MKICAIMNKDMDDSYPMQDISLPEAMKEMDMAKITYLVDTENVGTAWKVLLDKLTKQDKLILFYTDHSPCISYTDLRYILDYAGQFDMIKCYAGKNGLDFQLVSYLGFQLKTASKTTYMIISNDHGYDSVIKFWAEREGNVSRVSVEKLNEICSQRGQLEQLEHLEQLEQLNQPQADEPDMVQKPDYGEAAAIVMEVFDNGISDSELETLMDILKNNSKDKLQKIYTAIIKELGLERGADLYRKMKPNMKEIYQAM